MICASVTLIVNTSPVFMVTVSDSSLSNGSILIKAQSPLSTVCALISSICSSVSSAEYSHSSPLASLISPTVLSVSTFPTQTKSGFENSTLSTSATNFLVSSETVTSLSVSASSSVTSAELTSFSPLFVPSIIPRTSMRSVKLTNPPPGRLKSYILPFTKYEKSTV